MNNNTTYAERDFDDACKNITGMHLNKITHGEIKKLRNTAKFAGHPAIEVQFGGWFTHTRGDEPSLVAYIQEYDADVEGVITMGTGLIFSVEAKSEDVIREMRTWWSDNKQEAREVKVRGY